MPGAGGDHGTVIFYRLEIRESAADDENSDSHTTCTDSGMAVLHLQVARLVFSPA